MIKAILSGYFDIGFSIGIDDKVLDTIDTALIETLDNNGVKIIAVQQEARTLLLNDSCLKLGRGITLDFSDSKIMSEWVKDAITVALSEKFIADFAISNDANHEIQRFFNSENITYSARMRVYAYGIATIELTFEFNVTVSPEALMRIMQCFENAAYGLFGSSENLAYNLSEAAVSIFDSQCTNDRLRYDTLRSKPIHSSFAYTLFPSFTILFRSDDRDMCEQLVAYRTIQGDNYKISLLDTTTVWSSWYVIIQHAIGEYGTVLPEVVSVYNLFYGVCESFDKLLSANVAKLFYVREISVNENELGNLLEFKSLGCIVVNYTDVSNLTQDVEIKDIFETLNEGGKMEAWHKSINHSVDSLNSIREQMYRIVERSNDEQEKLRDKRITKFGITITTFTFISVIADFMNINVQLEKVPGVLRFGMYLLLILLLIFCIHRLFKTK